MEWETWSYLFALGLLIYYSGNTNEKTLVYCWNALDWEYNFLLYSYFD
jgi:hypothetical protein